MSSTQQTLAQMIRSKYPDSYNDMDDVSLEKQVLSKYPEYGDLRRTSEHKSSTPEGSYQARPSGSILNANESPAHTAVRGFEKTLGIEQEPTSLWDAYKQSGTSLGKLALNVLKDPLNAAQIPEGMATGLEEAGRDVYSGLARNDPRQIANATGTTAGVLGQGELADRVPDAISSAIDAAPAAKDALGRSLREPSGKLKTPVKTASRLGGAAAGHFLGLPGYGELGGYVLGPQLADLMIPEHPNPPGPRMKIPNRLKLPSPVSVEPPASTNPFQGATSSAASPEDAMFQRLFGPEYQEAGDLAEWETGNREGGPLTGGWSTSGTAGKLAIEPQFVNKFSPPERSSIVSPDSPAPQVKGSYWSFKEPALRKAVLSGDRDAAIVYRQRFNELPPGAGLLTDVGDRPLSGLYQSEKK